MRVTVLAVGSRGDVQPYVALAGGLAGAGHQVRVATHEPFRSMVTRCGLEFSEIRGNPRALLETEAAQAWLESARNPVSFLRRLRPLARQLGEEVADDALAASEDAEVIVSSALAAAGQHIAEGLGVPNVPALLQPLTPTAAFPSVLLPPRLSLGRTGNRLSHHATALLFDLPFRRQVNRWRRSRLGLPPVREAHFYRGLDRRRQPVLYGFSPLLVPRPPDWGPWVQVCGSWTLPPDPSWRPPAALEAFLGGGPPPVCIGFGSMRPRDPAAASTVIAGALRRSGCRGIVGAGWAGLEVTGDDRVLVVGDVPHDWLFPRTAAVVHHGGAGTTATALRAGVPSMAVPFFADQPFWGARAAGLGVGPSPLPVRRLSVEPLAAAIRTMRDSAAMRERAAAVGEYLRTENGVVAAVAWFDRNLAG